MIMWLALMQTVDSIYIFAHGFAGSCFTYEIKITAWYGEVAACPLIEDETLFADEGRMETWVSNCTDIRLSIIFS